MKVVSETVSIGGKDLFVHHWNKEKSNSSVIVVYHGFLGTFLCIQKRRTNTVSLFGALLLSMSETLELRDLYHLYLEHCCSA
jgi:hypothetical protein